MGLSQYLKYGTKESSMRLAMFFISIIFTGILILSSSTVIIILAINKQVIDWVSLSIFITSITTFTGVGLYFKKEQSKIERNAE